MKIALLTLFFLAFSIFVTAQKDVKLEINSKLPKKYTKDTSNRIATAAAQTFPFVELTIRKVEYIIAFDERSRKIKYIHTDDDNFVDAEGRVVDQEITVRYEDILVYDYFQLRLKPDKNGWQIVLGGGFVFDRDLINRIKKDGTFTTKIEAFVKGYNY